MKLDKNHIEMRNKVENLMHKGLTIEQIANRLKLPVGTRYIRKSAKWYKYCVVAKKNQRKAIEKHPNLTKKCISSTKSMKKSILEKLEDIKKKLNNLDECPSLHIVNNVESN